MCFRGDGRECHQAGEASGIAKMVSQHSDAAVTHNITLGQAKQIHTRKFIWIPKMIVLQNDKCISFTDMTIFRYLSQIFGGVYILFLKLKVGTNDLKTGPLEFNSNR